MAEGWDVIATHRDHVDAIGPEGHGDRMTHARLDVTRFHQFDALKRHLGGRPIDVPLSNAGIGLDLAGMRRIIGRLGAHETGQFCNCDGAPLVW